MTFLLQNHLICTVPKYDGPSAASLPITVNVRVKSGDKYSEPQNMIFTEAVTPNTSTSLPTTQIDGKSKLYSRLHLLVLPFYYQLMPCG